MFRCPNLEDVGGSGSAQQCRLQVGLPAAMVRRRKLNVLDSFTDRGGLQDRDTVSQPIDDGMGHSRRGEVSGPPP